MENDNFAAEEIITIYARMRRGEADPLMFKRMEEIGLVGEALIQLMRLTPSQLMEKIRYICGRTG